MAFPARWQSKRHRGGLLLVLLAALAWSGCQSKPAPAPPPPPAPPVVTPPPAPPPVAVEPVHTDDEIVVAGHRFHTGTTVITWEQRTGYNGYLPVGKPVAGRPLPPPNYGERYLPQVAGDKAPPRSIPPGLPGLQATVDQVVLHYDGSGLSKNCFNALQTRGLSIHFMVDVDGTVYQTLDLRERALHATVANSRSIGIEIANVGAFPPHFTHKLDAWYRRDPDGSVRLAPPAQAGGFGIHTPNFTARPARPQRVRGELGGHELVQYDFTPQQYAALIKLTAALCRAFPRLVVDYPRNRAGRLVTKQLTEVEQAKFRGLLGHFHVQDNKTDPGPAFQWDAFLTGVQHQLGAPK